MSTEESHAAAVLALLNTGRPTGEWKAWDLDELEDPKPTERIEVTVVRRVHPAGRADGTPRMDGWRIWTHYVADTITNGRVLRAHARARLEGISTTVDGVATTPILFEGGDPFLVDDEKFWSAYDSWTFTH